MVEPVRVPAIISDLLGLRVARGFARLCDLATVSRADIYDAKRNPTGTQRDLSPKHAKDAYDYVRTEEVAYWPEVFLGLRDSTYFSVELLDAVTGSCYVVFDAEKIRAAESIHVSRIDGNHRLHYADGHNDAYPRIEKVVSFCLAIDISQEQEIKLFRDINNNQRRMNTSHLDNIELRLSSELEVARRNPTLYIAQRLKDDPESALQGLVYDGGKSDVTKFIPLRALKSGLDYMFSRPTNLTAINDIQIQTLVIKSYFAALKRWQPNAFRQPKEYLLLRGAGLWGACFLGAEVIDRVLRRGNYRIDDMLAVLRSGRDWDWTKTGDFQGLSGRSGAVKIRDMIVSEMEDEAGVSLRSVIKQLSAGT